MSPTTVQITTTTVGSATSTLYTTVYDSSSDDETLLPGDLYLLADVILLGVVAVFFLFALPRAVTRLLRLSAWSEGLFLRAGARERHARHSRSPSASPKEGDVYDYSERSFAARQHTAQGRRVNFERGRTTTSPTTTTDDDDSACALTDSRPQRRPPAHMPAWSSICPKMNAWLCATLRPGYSVGGTLLLLGYSVLMLFVGLHGGNPFVQYIPAGWVGASQLPVAFLLGTKNNLLGILLGKGYEKVCPSC